MHSFVAFPYFTCFLCVGLVFSLRSWVSIVPSPLKWKRPLSSEKYHTTVVMQNGRSMHSICCWVKTTTLDPSAKPQVFFGVGRLEGGFVCVCAGLGQDQWWSYTNLESESYWMKISYNGNKQWGISKLWWYTMVNGSYNLRRTQTVESLI